MASSDVVLVGAGHAHLYIAARAASFSECDIQLTLVDPDAFWYSGLATGVLGGRYPPDLDRVDPQPLLESGGGRFVRDRVVGLDRAAGVALLQSGSTLHYDLISFNVGSEVALPSELKVSDGVWRAKPIRGLLELRERFEERYSGVHAASPPLRALVIGGGATGCEIAANIDALARCRGSAVRVDLVTEEPRLLAEHGPAVSRRLARFMSSRGITVHSRMEVVAVQEDACRTADGSLLPADLVVLATGLRPPRWLGGLGLELGPEGGLRVDATLRSATDSRVFGAGDCISLVGRQLPKLGVYAVREAPILHHNLLAPASGEPLREYRPQRRCLTILNLGLGTGLALWGPFHWLGPAAMWLKDRIDRRFLARYRPEH